MTSGEAPITLANGGLPPTASEGFGGHNKGGDPLDTQNTESTNETRTIDRGATAGRVGLGTGADRRQHDDLAVNVGNTLEITLGKVIERSGVDLRKVNVRYGPKQDYDARTKETRIYLPYGNTEGVYYEAHNAKLGDRQRAGSKQVELMADYAKFSKRCRRTHFYQAYGYDGLIPNGGCDKCDVCLGAVK